MHNSNYCYKGNLRFSCNLWYPQWFHMVCIQATHSNVIIIQVGKRPLFFFFFLHARSAIPIVYGWNYKQRVYKPCHIPLKAPKIATSWEHFLLMFFCLPLVLWLNLCDMLSRKNPPPHLQPVMFNEVFAWGTRISAERSLSNFLV